MDKHPRSGRKTPTGPKASEQTRALAITCEGKKTRDGGEWEHVAHSAIRGLVLLWGEHSQGRLPHEEKIDEGQGSAHKGRAVAIAGQCECVTIHFNERTAQHISRSASIRSSWDLEASSMGALLLSLLGLQTQEVVGAALEALADASYLVGGGERSAHFPT
jgi:hypothetical protein